jgi:hypothetical protein
MRNVIERTFGAVKAKWKMLKGMPHYPGTKQTQIIIALCALHNYVHDLEGEKQPGRPRAAADLGPLGIWNTTVSGSLMDFYSLGRQRKWKCHACTYHHLKMCIHVLPANSCAHHGVYTCRWLVGEHRLNWWRGWPVVSGFCWVAFVLTYVLHQCC